ncbi:dentin sialophosphoprotein isoform X1 [Spatholobus suberectus]|nr:dentin sialophosphoprotein isoform X1 [Spatholobus suberectus]
MSKTTIGNMETGTDACKEGIQSTGKRTGNYKNHSDIDIKAQTSDVGEPMELTEDNENAVLDQCHKNEAGKIGGAEEGREVSRQNDPELMLLENSTSSNQDNTDANIRELNVASKVVDVNGMTEPVKLEKEKRGMRKAKNSGGSPALREGIGLVDASESETVIMKSLSATNCDPTSGNTETEENPLNQTEGEKIQQEEMQGTSDKEDDFSADNAGSLEQIKTKSNAEHMDKRQRKISNNKQTSTSKSISNIPTKDLVLDSKKPSLSSDSGTHANPSVMVTKKSKSTSTKSSNKSSKTNLEPVKDSVRLEPSDSQFNSGSKDASRHSTHAPGEKDDDNLEAPSKTLKVNADQQFSSWKQQDEASLSDDMLVDKMNGTDRTDIKMMAGKNMHGLEATNGQTHAEDLNSSQQLSSKEELDVRIRPGKKVPNLHRTGQDSKLSGMSDRVVSLIGENGKARVNASGKSMGLEKRREHFPVSNSKLEGSIKMVQNKAGKASGNNVHGIVSKTQQRKSLLAGAIFKDDSSSTSEDEDAVDNSDASTRIPSDNPLLSDFSDGDSSSGSYGGRSLKNGGRSSLKASLSGIKGMPIDHVLRSSSRFKKTRTTASQLEETQSQPEFVPDSLAE